MLTETFIQLYERDLNKLKEEISLYKDEKAIWAVKGEVSNSAGNLCLHLIGNIKHFIGAALGNTGYIRQRDSEFTLKDVPRKELLTELDNTIAIAKSVIGKLSEEDLEKDFPFEFQNKKQQTQHMLVFFLAHLSYHLGQINYHRRLLD